MNTRKLPLALFGTLVGMAASASAGAAQPSPAVKPAPVRVEVVDEDTLSRINGKFYGADMLVGLRIELLSNWRTAEGSLSAAGTLQIQRDANGNFTVQVDTRSDAQNTGGAGNGLANGAAIGGDKVSVNGIGQVVQIAGDGNKFGNLTSISFSPRDASGGGSFNGQTSSTSTNGNLVASVSFENGGARLGLSAPSGLLSQSVISGADGGVLQAARVAGQDQIGSNTMQLQLQTATMPALTQQQLGIYEAMAGLRQLPR